MPNLFQKFKQQNFLISLAIYLHILEKSIQLCNCVHGFRYILSKNNVLVCKASARCIASGKAAMQPLYFRILYSLRVEIIQRAPSWYLITNRVYRCQIYCPYHLKPTTRIAHPSCWASRLLFIFMLPCSH